MPRRSLHFSAQLAKEQVRARRTSRFFPCRSRVGSRPHGRVRRDACRRRRAFFPPPKDFKRSPLVAARPRRRRPHADPRPSRSKQKGERWLRLPLSSSSSSVTVVLVSATPIPRRGRRSGRVPLSSQIADRQARDAAELPPDPRPDPSHPYPRHLPRQDHLRQASLDRRVREEVPS